MLELCQHITKNYQVIYNGTKIAIFIDSRKSNTF